MPQLWDADFEISPDHAAGLIDVQFPMLSPSRPVPLGNGWDNVAFVVNEVSVFRFPRRAVAVEFLEIETRWLPLIAGHVPSPIPAPTFVGEPADGFPYPFAGYPLIPGTTVCRAGLSNDDRALLAAPLGAFLRSLHLIPIDVETRIAAPGDKIKRADIAMRAPYVKRDIADAAGALSIDLATVASLIDRLAAAAPATETCWVHGDLYARHILVENGVLSGIIDWGDMHVGDPALDLSIAYSFLPASARRAFFDAYGVVDHATHDRARFRALHYAAILVPYGRDQNDVVIEAVGIDALRYALGE